MLPNEDTVRRIWAQSKGRWAFQSTKYEGTWRDYPIEEAWPTGGALRLQNQPHGHDLFFSALRATKAERANTNFAGAALLFADLDPVKPWKLDLKPTIAWETSPESYQAVWFMDMMIEDYEVWSDLSQRMTRHTGADPGGWMGSKALRWPGSLNWKRSNGSHVPFGTVLWDDGPEYAYIDLQNDLPPLLPRETIEDTDHPDPIHSSQVDNMYRLMKSKHWHKLGLRSRNYVSRDAVTDRSLFLAKLVRQLLSEGLTPEETFHLAWVQPYCKWRTDRDAPEVLWREIQKAVSAAL